MIPSFTRRRSITGANFRLPSFCGGREAVEQRVVLLSGFVQHARVDRGGEQIIRRGNGVNIAG